MFVPFTLKEEMVVFICRHSERERMRVFRSRAFLVALKYRRSKACNTQLSFYFYHRDINKVYLNHGLLA